MLEGRGTCCGRASLPALAYLIPCELHGVYPLPHQCNVDPVSWPLVAACSQHFTHHLPLSALSLAAFRGRHGRSSGLGLLLLRLGVAPAVRVLELDKRKDQCEVTKVAAAAQHPVQVEQQRGLLLGARGLAKVLQQGAPQQAGARDRVLQGLHVPGRDDQLRPHSAALHDLLDLQIADAPGAGVALVPELPHRAPQPLRARLQRGAGASARHLRLGPLQALGGHRPQRLEAPAEALRSSVAPALGGPHAGRLRGVGASSA
mmetsp:Transcript_100831/g.268048  ORF Transcript_100831/g.268048 Transcript_100831/m.268048 type:complete len:260 (+) Transcript_100831:85-864(+)